MLQQLDDKIAEVVAHTKAVRDAVATASADQHTALVDLKAKLDAAIKAGTPPPPDVSTELAALDGVDATLTDLAGKTTAADAEAKAADPGAPPAATGPAGP